MASFENKGVVTNLESSTSDADASDYKDTAAVLASLSPAEESRLVRRLDWKLVPMTGAMYSVSLLDRTNVAAAAIAGMTTELKLAIPGTIDRYSLIALVFFITYTIFQLPATAITRFFGPRIFLPSICLAWGAVIIGSGFVKKWGELVPLRIVLGIFEAGLFPGIVYLLSTWYTRQEVGKRYGAFYLFGMLTSGFSGILAFGLLQMNGLQGLGGWRWIFIIEGVLTSIVAIFGYCFMLGFPDQKPFSLSGKFVSESELRYILARVESDRSDAAVEPFSFNKWLSGGTDFKIWLYALGFMSTTAVTYGLGYFMPQILQGAMGFSVGKAQCLVAPPYVLAAIIMMVALWASDRYKQRGIPIVVCSLLSLIGLCITGLASNNGARYFGLFLGSSGANSNIPLLMTWQANNIRGQWKRAFCSASLIGFGGIGGIIGTTVFRKEDAPSYIPGLATCAGLCGLMAIIALVLLAHFFLENKKQAKGKVLEQLEGFRYIY